MYPEGGRGVTFNSWEFILFYPIVLLLYFVLPKKMRWPMLLVASYFFYMCYSPDLVFLIFGTTLISWVASRIIDKTEKKAIKRLAIVVTLIASLGVLFFYKYFNFLSTAISSVVGLFGGPSDPVLLDLVLPVGISFYTFQTLSYAIDVYRGDVKSERNFFFYALFVSFFPQLVAGPIERPDNLIPQLREAHPWSTPDAIKGAKHMLVGFFKKVCVADLLSSAVDSVYNSPEEAGSLAIAIATVLFAVQIYCDFSGYTDIAIGCARIMGIRLMKNFDHPYSATTIKEFWARWHISLSSWFRDYLYIPLGGNRCSRARHLFNLFVVFLVSGLWHGANWTFVVWGALHGVYQIVGNLTARPRARLVERSGRAPTSPLVVWPRRIITFILVCFAWIFFRANTMSDALLLIKRLFSFTGGGIGATLSSMGVSVTTALLMVVSVVLLILIDRMLTYDDSPDGSDVLVSRGGFVYFVWIILLSWALLLSKDMISTFIYFQF